MNEKRDWPESKLNRLLYPDVVIPVIGAIVVLWMLYAAFWK